MAIYHLSAKVLSRQSSRTALGAASYRSGEKLQQEGIGGVLHDYSRKAGVVYKEILAPQHAPKWALDRETLWNHVDRYELRKDAQLAREVEVALPVELSLREQVELLREFANQQFVSRGMVADVAIHHDNPANPHAHILLTMRTVGPDGFGKKEREWNQKDTLRRWREAWASTANHHLAMAGLEARIDHRSYFEQGIELTPGRKIGASLERQGSDRLPPILLERIADQQRIARENGERIIADPTVALAALTHHRATFSKRDVALFLHTRTDGAEQFQAAMTRLFASEEVVTLRAVGKGDGRFTTREMISIERGLFDRALAMSERPGHSVNQKFIDAALGESSLSAQQRAAFRHITTREDVSAVVGVAGSGKSTMLAAAREAWEAQGYSVKGAALSGIAAESLQRASGIASRTIASYELAWRNERDLLGRKDVLVIDEAGMVGTRQMARVFEAAEKAGAKVVLVGDPEQLQAIEAGAPFRGILSQIGMAELTEVHRQQALWQREATRQMASGETAAALIGYELRELLHAHQTLNEARDSTLRAWAQSRHSAPDKTSLMLAFTRVDVSALNDAARELRKAQGELAGGERVETSRGTREFAVGDRIYFLRNERSLGVKNGTLATVEAVRDGVLQVALDIDNARKVVVDTGMYKDIDHGYASTIHKSQGVTVDRAFVLASPHFDRHTTYVALSRHRESAEVHFAREDFSTSDDLKMTLSRARPKELAIDYIDDRGALPHKQTRPTESAAPELGYIERFKERVQAAFERRRAEIATDSDRHERSHRQRAGASKERLTGDHEQLARGQNKEDPKREQEPSRPKDFGFER
jgi:Ti-type conjugative transfer relaxase TraA